MNWGLKVKDIEEYMGGRDGSKDSCHLIRRKSEKEAIEETWTRAKGDTKERRDEMR